MINTLSKDTFFTTTPGTSGRPATPGTPGRDAYYSYEDVSVCGIYVVGGRYEWVYPLDGSEPQYMLVPGSGGSMAEATYKCVTTTKRVFHPAVASVPADPGEAGTEDQIDYNYNLGWNAGARSLDFIAGDGYVEFTVVNVVGLCAGMNGENSGTGYTEMEHALFLSDGLVRIYESGADVASGGTYTLDDEFRIQRQGGVVTYWKNGALIYTSLVASTGTVFLDVSMYSGGDTITNPAIVGMAGGNLTLPGLEGVGSELAFAQAVMTLPMLTLSSYFFQGAALTLPNLALLGADRIYGDAQITLPALTLASEGGFALPPYALAALILPALQQTAFMLTGEVGGATLTLPNLSLLGADRVYGDAQMTLPAMTLFSESYEGPLAATIAQLATGTPAFTGSSQIAVVMTSSGTVACVLAYSAARAVTMSQSLTADDALSAQAVLSALMQNGVLAAFSESGDAPGEINADFQVWTLDLETGANTAYEQYAFNSFAKVGDNYFGVKAGGVYLLEGDTDAGVPIRASINLGKHDFGTSQHKHVPHVYAGISSTGVVVLRVSVDGGESYLYNVRAVDANQQIQRFDLGKGLKGSYFTFELYNQDGAGFDLDTIEFLAIPTERKI